MLKTLNIFFFIWLVRTSSHWKNYNRHYPKWPGSHKTGSSTNARADWHTGIHSFKTKTLSINVGRKKFNSNHCSGGWLSKCTQSPGVICARTAGETLPHPLHLKESFPISELFDRVAFLLVCSPSYFLSFI